MGEALMSIKRGSRVKHKTMNVIGVVLEIITRYGGVHARVLWDDTPRNKRKHGYLSGAICTDPIGKLELVENGLERAIKRAKEMD
jgi:hypothetical protein